MPHKGALDRAATKSNTKEKMGFVSYDIGNEGEVDINNDFIVSTMKVQYIGSAPIRIREAKMKENLTGKTFI